MRVSDIDRTERLHKTIRGKFPGTTVTSSDRGLFPFIQVKLESLAELLEFCLNDAELKLDFLECLSAVDKEQDFVLVYQLFSSTHGHRLNLKVNIDRNEAKAPTVTGLWRAARYYELEVADMFGIRFEGHPHHQRLLMPEDWVGYPLRKDYAYPEQYHDVEHRRAPMRKEHRRP